MGFGVRRPRKARFRTSSSLRSPMSRTGISAQATPTARPARPLLLCAFLAFLPSPATAQELITDLLVPAGRVRVELAPTFQAWDNRFAPGGTRPLGADLTHQDGTELFPGVAALEEQLRGLADSQGYEARLGSTQGRMARDLTRVDMGLHVGIFHRLTVGVTVPVVRGHTGMTLAFSPDTLQGDLGLNPNLERTGVVSAFLEDLQNALAGAESRADALCGADPTGPGCQDAAVLAERVGGFLERARTAYSASPFFPLEGTDMAGLLTSAVEVLNGELASAGLAGVGTMVFASERPTADGLADLTTNPLAGIGAERPLGTVDGLWTLGDVEASATLRLLDDEVVDSGAAVPRMAWTLAAGGLVRLGTGSVDDPDVLLDQASGDGQMDIEGRVAGALRLGGRLAIRGGARYGIQRSRTMIRRVAPPDAILAPLSARHAVRWSPAAYLGIEASPRLHLTDELTLSGAYRLFHKGADQYEYLATGDLLPAGAPDIGLLSQGTGVTRHRLGVGLTYSTMRGWRRGDVGSPLELSVHWVRTVSASGGFVPEDGRLELRLRAFRRLWGRDPAQREPEGS